MPTKQEIKNEILNDITSIGYSTYLSVRNDSGLLSLINAPRIPKTKSRFISARTLLAEGTVGVSILEKYKALADGGNAQAKWTLLFLNQEGGIDIGLDNAQATVDYLESVQVFTPEEATLLRTLPKVNVSRAEDLWGRQLTLQELSEALNSNN